MGQKWSDGVVEGKPNKAKPWLASIASPSAAKVGDVHLRMKDGDPLLEVLGIDAQTPPPKQIATCQIRARGSGTSPPPTSLG